MRFLIAIAAFALVATGTTPALAAIEGTPSGAGFTVFGEVPVSATPDATWARLIDVGSWWSSAHSWSGDAHNMTLEPRAGGCWCEALPNGGSIQHGRVIAFVPGQRLLLSAELGPLQGMPVNGKLEWRLAAASGGGTILRYRYQLWGHVRAAADQLAAGVDGVMAEQAQRLAASLSRP